MEAQAQALDLKQVALLVLAAEVQLKVDPIAKQTLVLRADQEAHLEVQVIALLGQEFLEEQQEVPELDTGYGKEIRILFSGSMQVQTEVQVSIFLWM